MHWAKPWRIFPQNTQPTHTLCCSFSSQYGQHSFCVFNYMKLAWLINSFSTHTFLAGVTKTFKFFKKCHIKVLNFNGFTMKQIFLENPPSAWSVNTISMKMWIKKKKWTKKDWQHTQTNAYLKLCAMVLWMAWHWNRITHSVNFFFKPSVNKHNHDYKTLSKP